MKLGIVGSRRRNSVADRGIVFNMVSSYYNDYRNELVLISGGCAEGADSFAEEVAEEFQIPIVIHHPKLPPPGSQRFEFTKAYYERNELIAKDCDSLLALVAEDRKGGTENTIKFANKFGKNVMIL